MFSLELPTLSPEFKVIFRSFRCSLRNFGFATVVIGDRYAMAQTAFLTPPPL
jgi:hypothetical protein